MHGYLLLVMVVVLVGPAWGAGCGDKKTLCCRGKDNACKTHGERMNGKSSKTCFCDEACLLQGDCCTDFNSVCLAQDCAVGDFDEWGECSTQCGAGFRIRTRPVLQEPMYGGKQCNNLEEKRFCWGNKCKVARHSSSGIMEARETGKIIPAQYGEWRKNKFFDPYKDIRRNLFNHYSANKVIRRPPYCAKYEMSYVKSSCSLSTKNPWASRLHRGATVCVECQPLAMKRNLGVRCKGHGVYKRETRWNAVTVPGCHGKWVMTTRHEECTCSPHSHSAFILI